MKHLLTFACALVLALSANAQTYKDAVGLSFCPDYSGPAHIASVQWKHFLNQKNALDIRAGYQFKWGPHASALYEWNFPIKDSGFNFYAGPGAHVGFVHDYNGFGDSCVTFGFTGAVGFEYEFNGIPLALSIDWRPYLTWQPAINKNAGFGYKGFDVGIKYCF